MLLFLWFCGCGDEGGGLLFDGNMLGVRVLLLLLLLHTAIFLRVIAFEFPCFCFPRFRSMDFIDRIPFSSKLSMTIRVLNQEK